MAGSQSHHIDFQVVGSGLNLTQTLHSLLAACTSSCIYTLPTKNQAPPQSLVHLMLSTFGSQRGPLQAVACISHLDIPSLRLKLRIGCP